MRNARGLRNAWTLPLLAGEQILGAVQIFNFEHVEVELITLICDKLASELHQANREQAYARHDHQLLHLINVMGLLGSTLNQREILKRILNSAAELIDAEASSIFLLSRDGAQVVMYASTDLSEDALTQIKLPRGEGIISQILETGEPLIVSDIENAPRHSRLVDDISGKQTRSILAVPLKTYQIDLGVELGTRKAQIIGGLEAINKKEGRFDMEDLELLSILSRQAATVLQIAQYYADLNDLFLQVAHAFSAAIDAKDPYTRGHSQRVADYAVAIAHQLQLPSEIVRDVQLGAVLHDIGKIGVPDAILQKPGQLTQDEMRMMQKHPEIGEKILQAISNLHGPLLAIAEHHERLDGSGYPIGLNGYEISLIGRIVAVADVFDAMTSDRTYRGALAPEEAIRQLNLGLGTEFDPLVVQALIRAYHRNQIKTQKQRLI